MAKLGTRRGPWATIPVLEKTELVTILDRKKLASSVDGVNNIVLNPISSWSTGTLFIVGDIAVANGLLYECTVEHTSGASIGSDAANWQLVSKPGTVVVADIPARDAITGLDLFTGLAAYVVDASADGTVDSGAALYVYNSGWVKISEFESLDITINDAAEGTKGIAELATQGEVTTGTNDTKMVTPLKLRTEIGDSSTLATTATTLVTAVNELHSEIDDIAVDEFATRTDSNISATGLASDHLVRLNATGAGASQTYTLPAISGVNDGKVIWVVGLGTDTYNATIAPDGSDTILGGNLTLSSDGHVIALVANLVNTQWEVLVEKGAAVVAGVQNNFAATTDPTNTNDSGEGYEVGSVWVNTTTSESFRCTDATASSAVWEKSTLTADELPSSRSVLEYNSASGDFTLAATVKLVVLTMAGTDNVNITLNPAAQYPDIIKVRRLGTGTGTITITPNGSEDIDGVTGALVDPSELQNAPGLILMEPISGGFILG